MNVWFSENMVDDWQRLGEDGREMRMDGLYHPIAAMYFFSGSVAGDGWSLDVISRQSNSQDRLSAQD